MKFKERKISYMAPTLFSYKDHYQMAWQFGRLLYTRSFQALNLVARGERSVLLSNLRARLVESDSSKTSFTRKTNAIIRLMNIVTLSLN